MIMDDGTIMIPLNDLLDGLKRFCTQEEIDDMEDDADKIAIIVRPNGDVGINAFCGKSFNEAMSRGEFDVK